MLRLRKGAAPPCIRELRETPGADWGTVNAHQNAAILRRGRAAVADEVARSGRSSDATALRRMLEHWEGRDSNGRRAEYAGVAIYFLRKRLAVVLARARRTRKDRKR